MRHKGWIVLAACLAAVALVYGLLQPVFVFQALANAGQAGDRDRLAAMVDFPAVREDLKDQLSARIDAALSKDRSPFGALGALLGPSVVDQVVDAAVTPEGVAAIVRSGRAPLSELSARKTALPPPPETAPPPPAAASLAPAKARTRFAYTGLNSFKATSVSKDGAELGWVLERRGLNWKLARIELPPA
ncbi:MAG TPA: DUF2939 domain-containing protein [Caulobacteraceae bacterium]|jgi:hypothetical protein|nr:DUF2939 domain-containing protein [Caulobacteraceae bacterium]